MTDNQIEEMIRDIATKYGKDIYLLGYYAAVVERSNSAKDNMAAMVKLVRRHLPYSTDE